MKLPEIGVKRPVLTAMFFIATLVFGLYSLRLIPIDLLPKIEAPVLTVLTTYPGSSADDIEVKVTRIIEKSLASVPNLKKITSISKENISVVTLEFDWGTDLDEAANDCRSSLEFAKVQLPDGVESPKIFKFSTEQFPVIVAGVTAPGNIDYKEFKDFVDDNIADRLVRIPGVGGVQAFGAPAREIRVDFDPYKLKAYNLNINQIAQVVRAENLSIPAGSIDDKKLSYILRLKGEYTSPIDIGNVVVGASSGKIIYLKDIAQIVDTVTRDERRTLINGEKGVVVLMNKLSGANTVAVSEALKKEIKKIEDEYKIKINIVFDGADFIKKSINNLFKTFLTSLVLVSLVVLLFLRRVRASLIIVVSIPFSLILAFFFMYVAKYTINILSLSSIAIAVGMVVDNSIVVLENVVKHLERGEHVKEASMYGASEVGSALLASTLTTIAVFAPLFFLTGIAGILFTQLAAITTITISMSLIVSLFLTPMLTSTLLKKFEEKVDSQKFLDRLFNWSENIFNQIDQTYYNILKWALNHKKTTLVGGFLFLVLSLGLIPFIGSDFIPESDNSQLQIIMELPVGTSVYETEAFTYKIYELVKSRTPEIKDIFYQVGQSASGLGSVFGTKEGDNIGLINIRLVDVEQRKRSNKEIANDLREMLKQFPKINKLNVLTQAGGQAAIFGQGKPISIEILGPDLNASRKVAEKIKDQISKVKGIVEPQISLQENKPEITIEIDKEKAALLGLNTAIIGTTLRSLVFGNVPTQFRGTKTTYDIRLRLDEKFRMKIEDIENIEVTNVMGKPIPLKNFAKIKTDFSPVEIDRKNQERIVKVEAGLSGTSLGQAVLEIENILKEIPVPPNTRIELGGSYEQQQEAFSDLLLLLLLSIVLVYIVMSAQFENLLDPFVIMFSIPFAFSGVLIGLFTFGQTLNVISFLGIIMLVGIVVNNAIVLVDFINILRARGQSLIEAILNGGRSRLRPVLMTAFTTIFGLLPLALSTGSGSETWKPLGASLVGGMVFSTFITLVIVPVIYSIFEKRLKKQSE
ncbi:MAG: efflux RND transporter permease subunit [Ignavibacteria bacterium]|nr:efflux RND transporter permease subunit [Ignavibacteria bacterium]